MDLEEELSLFHQEEFAPTETDQQSQTNESANKDGDDLLGLDQTIKLSSRAKVAKIDNERIFNKQKGLNYVIQNHSKLIRVFQKNDKALQKTLSSKRTSLSSKAVRHLKHENEFKNLSSMLQFYQLWCHGLFPKAKFKDCLQLVRSFGSKSGQLKLYRRELIEQELRKLKESKGIIDTERIKTPETHHQQDNTLPENQEAQVTQDIADDDWSFMKTNQTNGLFVGDDDDLYHTPTTLSTEDISRDIDTTASNLEHDVSTHVPNTKTNATENANESDESDDPFSDDDIPIRSEAINKHDEYPIEENEIDDHEHEDELAVMREMGL
ncbi:uncharacterized protein AC631_03744 [Debaryomyces fabryi]|uniref:Chromosome segregation in meiosis protein n=1 Tax=Debaryomyces fabryi TaxID=58627 RepID=A0A0V1PW88_9ASCO|nr:uncharacterized protein AC631_03744 [Debaryomyces fabryi]KSA00513.1 hypothetical protein AC631_03744 [Debaryomyces fabryi]CUM45586.1 unnamed protein product [Debaryomyces fabryi]